MNDPETITIKPAPDRRVRHESGQLLADVGETVPRTPYWARRLADEDVVETKAAAAMSPAGDQATSAGVGASETASGDKGAGDKADAGRGGAKGDKA